MSNQSNVKKLKPNDMVAIGNEELRNQPDAASLAGDKGYFEIIHTNDDGSDEICKVTQSKNVATGLLSWTMGCYTTNDGRTYLAVLGGKIIENTKLLF